MRTTIDLPEELIIDAMKATRIKTKTDVIKAALTSLIQKERISNIKKYQGKLNLEIDLDRLRKR
jgi:Arc/MetJ family transcription regulator